MRLKESLIDALEVNIRLGLIDAELREKHGIPKPTWQRWKRRGEEDRNKGLKTLYTMLLDRLDAGREGVVPQTKKSIVKMALGEWIYVSITKSINKSGETIRTVIRTANRHPDLKAIKLLLRKLDPERWSKDKKRELISSVRVAVVDLPQISEDEWLRKYGPKKPGQKAESDDELDDELDNESDDESYLKESLIDALEADSRLGLTDTELWQKHDIPEHIWYLQKWRGEEERNKGLKTLHAMLFDRLDKGRKKALKQLENILAEMALGKGETVITTTSIDKLGITIKAIKKTTNRKPNLKAEQFWLSYRDPKTWDKSGKKSEIIPISAIIPDYGKITDEEWQKKYFPKKQEQTARTDDESDDK